MREIFTGFFDCFSRQSLLLCGKEVLLLDCKTGYNEAVQKYLFCLSRKKIKHHPERIWLHADEYASFLVFFARQCYLCGHKDVAEVAYLVNRRLHSFDCFYTRKLPDLFHLEHPIGSILGSAEYGERLVVYQGVTVGGDVKERYPVIGSDVVLFANSSLIGTTTVGFNCAIGCGVQLYAVNVASGTAVSLRGSSIRMSSMSWSVSKLFFKK
jgi:serine O-acetyltransferase